MNQTYEFHGIGGTYLVDAIGTRIRMLPEWDGALPDFAFKPDMLAALAEGTVEQIISALPALGQEALARLEELEVAGKARSTALDAIHNAQGE